MLESSIYLTAQERLTKPIKVYDVKALHVSAFKNILSSHGSAHNPRCSTNNSPGTVAVVK